MDLQGARVLVTGASRGIGEAVARRFGAAGATVALVARSETAIEALARELGGSAHPCDLTDPGAVRGLLGRVEADAGPVDVLVNNAGVDMSGGFTELSADDLERIYRLNLLTPAELCRQAVPLMLRRGRGHLVNVSSMAGIGCFPGLAAYSSTKAGLTHLTAGLRADLQGLPVGTTVVELGPIPTDLLDHVEGYRPTRASFRRARQLGVLADVPREAVAEAIVAAVQRGRRHVRLPKRMAGLAMLAEAPRRMTELLLTGVPARER